MTAKAGEALLDPLEALLHAGRPQAHSTASLERKLAVASILAASTPDREHVRLGRLEVQSRIGGGAMGVVYRAYDSDLQRLVAVKLVRSWTGPEERSTIADEARALARLNHPNVVAVYDIVNDADGLYFTMERSWPSASRSSQASERRRFAPTPASANRS